MTRVIAIVNAKGGVGKTTLANNLAVYLRTVDSTLPILVMGLGDRTGPDDMFALEEGQPTETTYTALRRGRFDSAIRPGRYGVYYVPSSPATAGLARQPMELAALRRALWRTSFSGVVIIDTASDFGALTQSAIVASDLSVVPVADLASLVTAGKVFDLLEDLGRPRARARVLLSMLDLRIKYKAELCSDVLGLLVASTRRLEFPLFQGFTARSPAVQALATNPEGRTFSILNEASRTLVHRQMGELAEELLEVLGRLDPQAPETHRRVASRATREVVEGPLAWLHPRTPEAALALNEVGQESLCVRRFPYFIGRRDPGVLNDLAMPDVRPWQVSRRHAHLIRRDGRIGVVDLGSRLGTFVNGHRIGGPTADPGPVFFGTRGGVLILGEQRSPYAFDVAVEEAIAEPLVFSLPAESPRRRSVLASLLRAVGVAALTT